MAKETEAKRDAFLKALVERAKTDKGIELVGEPRLDGAIRWNADEFVTQKMAVYASNADARAWLKSQDAFLRSGKFDGGEDGASKYYLRRTQDEWPQDVLDAVSRVAPFGENRPLVIADTPARARIAMVTLDAKDAGQVTASWPLSAEDTPVQMLLMSVPQDAIGHSLRVLQQDVGLVARDSYDSLTKNGTLVFAAPLPKRIADSLMAGNPEIEDWRMHASRGVTAWMEEALVALPPREETPKVATESKKKKVAAPAPEPVASAKPQELLRDRREAIRALGITVMDRPLMTGGIEHGIAFAGTAALLTSGVSDAVKLGEKQKLPDGRFRYTLSEETLERLKDLFGPLAQGPMMPMDTRQVSRIFDKGKNEPGYTHAIFAEELMPDASAPSRYYCYMASRNRALLQQIRSRLDLSDFDALQHVSDAEEVPGMIRIMLPKEAWDALKEKVESVRKTWQNAQERLSGLDRQSLLELNRHNIARTDLTPSYSLQSLDNEARECAGLTRLVQSVEGEAKKPEQQKLSGEAAEARLMALLADANIDDQKMVVAQVKPKQKAGKAQNAHAKLFVRAPTDTLNRIMNVLAQETAMFRKKAEMRTFKGARTGQGLNVLEVDISDALLERVEKKLGVERIRAETEEGVFEGGHHDRVRALFLSRETQVRQRDAVAEGLQHLRGLKLAQVLVTAPDETRLQVLEREYARIEEVAGMLDAPLETLSAQSEVLAKGLENLRLNLADKTATQIVQQALSDMRTFHSKISQGLPRQLRNRISEIRAQHAALIEKGVRVDWLTEGEKRSAELLKPLVPEYLEAIGVCGAKLDMLQLTPTEKGREAMRVVGGSIPTLESGLVPIDAMQRWSVNQLRALFTPTNLVQEVEQVDAQRDAGAIMPLEKVVPLRRDAGARQVTLKTALNRVHGLLATEQQEPLYPHLPRQETIGAQHVLVLSASNAQEIQANIVLRAALEQAGALLAEPRYYNGIIPGEPHDAVAEPEAEPEKIQQLRASKDMWEALHSAVDNAEFAARSVGGPVVGNWNPLYVFQQTLPEISRQWAKQDETITPSTEWKKFTEEAKKLGFDSRRFTALGQATSLGDGKTMGNDFLALKKLVHSQVRKAEQLMLNEGVVDRPLPSRPAMKRGDDMVVSVKRGGADFYALQELDGHGRAGYEPSELHSWRKHLQHAATKGNAPVAALKLYLTDEGMEMMRALLGKGRSQRVELCDKVLSPEMLENKMYYHQQNAQRQV